MIFRFVVKHMRWLGRIPLLPQFFDALLLFGTALFNRKKLKAMELFESVACAEPDIRIVLHRFGGTAFVLRSAELCHLHGNGLFDAYVGSSNRIRLINDGKALPHHVFPGSGWISFWISDGTDAINALEIMRLARKFQSGQCIGVR